MAELKCADGTVVQISAETEKELRKVFEPKHKWAHGDVFKFRNRSNRGVMIYLKSLSDDESIEVKYIDKPCYTYSDVDDYLDSATFLFNINDIIKDKL